MSQSDHCCPRGPSRPPHKSDTFLPPHKSNTLLPLNKRDTFRPPHKSDTFLPPHKRDTLLPAHKSDTLLHPHKSDTLLPAHKSDTLLPPHKSDTLLPPHKSDTFLPPHKSDTLLPPHNSGTCHPPNNSEPAGVGLPPPNHIIEKNLIHEAIVHLPILQTENLFEADLISWSLHKQLAPRSSIPGNALCHLLDPRANGGEGSGMGPPGKPWEVRLGHWLGQWKILMKANITDYDVAFIYSTAPSGLVSKTLAFLGCNTSVAMCEHLIVILTAASARIRGVTIGRRAMASFERLQEHKAAVGTYVSFMTRILQSKCLTSERIQAAASYILAESYAPRVIPPTTFQSFINVTKSNGKVDRVECRRCNSSFRKVCEASQHMQGCMGLEVWCDACKTWRPVGRRGELLTHDCG